MAIFVGVSVSRSLLQTENKYYACFLHGRCILDLSSTHPRLRWEGSTFPLKKYSHRVDSTNPRFLLWVSLEPYPSPSQSESSLLKLSLPVLLLSSKNLFFSPTHPSVPRLLLSSPCRSPSIPGLQHFVFVKVFHSWFLSCSFRGLYSIYCFLCLLNSCPLSGSVQQHPPSYT